MITRIELTTLDDKKMYVNIPSIDIVRPEGEHSVIEMGNSVYQIKDTYEELVKKFDDYINRRDLLQKCFVKAEAERNWFATLSKTKTGTEKAVLIAQAKLCVRFCDWISWGPENEESDRSGAVM